MSLPRVREDLHALDGYHSAQIDVEVRLNTNESPLPPPPAWLESFRSSLGGLELNRYPDRRATDLRRALADLHRVEVERVFCANGSNEILQCLLLAYGGPGRNAAVFEPTYTLHRHIARITNTAVVAGQRLDDFRLDLGEVVAVLAEHDPAVTFLCSPNNPSGRSDTRIEMATVLDATPGLLVVDEAYGSFSGASALVLADRDTAEGQRLVVVRTFSKTWAMAGLRLGYLIADPEVVLACEQVALPYHLDAAKQLAGRLALGFVDEMERRVALVTEERGRIAAGLGRLPVETWPSDANFILFRPRTVEAGEVWKRLLVRSVLVRDCSRWPGVEGCLRVTVGTPDENDRFLRALTETLS